MSTNAPPIATPPRSSAFGRYMLMLLIGLALGAIAVTMIMSTLERRKTWRDRWPHTVMQTFATHTSLLDESIKENRCAATDILPHLQTLRDVANDLEPAFPGETKDPKFGKYASDFRAAADGARNTPPATCEAAKAALSKINDQCKACHQDFRH